MNKPEIFTVGLYHLQKELLQYTAVLDAGDVDVINRLVPHLDTRGDIQTRWDVQGEVESLATYLKNKYYRIMKEAERDYNRLYYMYAGVLGTKGVALEVGLRQHADYEQAYLKLSILQCLSKLTEDLTSVTFNTRDTMQQKSYNHRRELNADNNAK